MDIQQTFADRHNEILERIAAAAARSGRSPSDVALIGACKRQPDGVIAAALEQGLSVFGENRVQEAQARWTDFSKHRPEIELHLIGQLQSNKAMDAVRCFDVIQTVDRLKIAHALKGAMDQSGRRPRLFVQVNTGEEPQKAGVLSAELPEFLDRLRSDVGLHIEGLMCIPPVDEPASLHFAFLAKLADQNDIRHRSMGMSADYETAVTFDATYVRVGSALFGERST